MTVDLDTVRGLRAKLTNPDREVACRMATDDKGRTVWQLESEIVGKPDSRQTFTVTNEALAAILEARTILLRDPVEIARTLQARERSPVDFTPIRVEPTRWAYAATGPGFPDEPPFERG